MEASDPYSGLPPSPSVMECALSESMLFGCLQEHYVIVRDLGTPQTISTQAARAELVRGRLVEVLETVKNISSEMVGSLPVVSMLEDEHDDLQS